MARHLLDSPGVEQIAIVDPIEFDFSCALPCIHFKIKTDAQSLADHRLKFQPADLLYAGGSILEHEQHLKNRRIIQVASRRERFSYLLERNVLMAIGFQCRASH